MDRTLILVKPDAFARGLTGEIVARFERKGLKIVALRHMTVTRELAERHYAEHAERPFFGELVEFITSGPIVAMVLEGADAVKAARQVIGATNPLEAARARSEATSRWRWARTWSTARTRPSRPRARRRCSSESCSSGAGVASRASAPGASLLVLASGSPQRRAMLERLGVEFSGAALRGRASSIGAIRDDRAARTRCARRARRIGRAERGGARMRHGGRRSAASSTASPRTRREARETLRRLSGASTKWSVGSRCCRRAGRPPPRAARARRSPARRSPSARWGRSSRLVSGDRGVARAGRGIRDPGRRGGSRAERGGDYENVVGLPAREPARHLPRAVERMSGRLRRPVGVRVARPWRSGRRRFGLQIHWQRLPGRSRRSLHCPAGTPRGRAGRRTRRRAAPAPNRIWACPLSHIWASSAI